MVGEKEALDILKEFVKSESLRNHCMSVAKAMEFYARKKGLREEDVENWKVCGLLHDFDWEIHPSIEEHPVKGQHILRERGVSEEIVQAILGHGNHTGVKRESDMAKTLFAVDELSGLIVAISKVRPGGFSGMRAESVVKAMKKKDFASAINREDILQGIREIEIDMKEHFENVINALSKV